MKHTGIFQNTAIKPWKCPFQKVHDCFCSQNHRTSSAWS